MVQLERVWDGDLEFGVVVLSFAVQVNPNAGHCEGVSGLGLIDVRHWNALHTKTKPIQNAVHSLFLFILSTKT